MQRQPLIIHTVYWTTAYCILIYVHTLTSPLDQALRYSTLSLLSIVAATYLIIYWAVSNYLFRFQIFIFKLITIAILLSVLNIQIIYVIIHQILLPDLKEIDPWALPYDIAFMILSTLAIASPAIVYESLRLWSLERNKRLILDQENRDFKEKFESRTEFLTVQSRGKTYRIPIKDVLYIESFGDYSHIHLSDRKVISRITLKELERLSKKFLRIHRSYIANSDHCKAFNNNEVIINNIKIPVGRSYKRNISKLFM